MATIEPLPGFEDRAPRDRYCDLILTGGVTSSIAYPAAIFALASAYRFNSIGGSSSGAGAAALAAAAEYRRRHGSSDGFRIMLERSAEVADKVRGKTRLEWLFQPEAQNKRLFKALLPGFAMPTGKGRKLLGGLLRAYGSWIAVGLLIALVFIGFAVVPDIERGVLDTRLAFLIGVVATLILLLSGAAAMILMLALDVGRLMRNDYGLCCGTVAGKVPCPPPLTDWLHGLIQEIAGRGIEDPPLTFADLAAAPGSPRETLNDPSPMGVESINLQMFTANVTHGRPYIFPQKGGEEENDPPLYFCESEMRQLFPASIVDDMMVDRVTGKSNLYAGEFQPARSDEVKGGLIWSLMRRSQTRPTDKDLYELPRVHLPILVAARMSVSFPVLFSAVPFWILDRRGKTPVFRRCLFCDGGICSAFPIHLFDSAVPSWPTFAISLHELPPRAKPGQESSESTDGWFAPFGHEKADYGVVWLPEDHIHGKEDFWSEFETEPNPFEKLAGFFSALASTTKNWNDATVARLPGVRERVVRVGLRPGVGGLNILMTPEQIRGLADLGRRAGLKLLKRFALPVPSPEGDLPNGWNEHRWVRLNVLRDSLANSLAGLSWAAVQAGHGKPLSELIRQSVDEHMLHNDENSRLLTAQAAAMEGALATLMEAERALTASTVKQPYKPSPRPVMRVRPPL